MLRGAALLALTVAAEAAPQFSFGGFGGGGGGGGVTMLRFGCPQVVIDRLDPLVNPGELPSGHVHQVVGGNAFNVSMPKTDISKLATCTTCQFSEDFSNYWTSNLYYRSRNGSLKRVPQGSAALQFNDKFSNEIDGGVLVYYVSADPGKITAFKPGFRMLVGDAANRQESKVPRGLCFRCESNMQQNPFGGAPCTGADTPGFPKEPCGGGWRVTVTFPSCWDGTNIDSPDHKSHIAYPASGTFETGGACPSTHPVKIPQVMYEVIFDTRQFNSKADWPADGSQPFFWSMGDRTGYAIHGDYMFGWKGDALQRAMDTKCAGDNCPALTRQSNADAIACTQKQMAHENIGDDMWLKTLPGINPSSY